MNNTIGGAIRRLTNIFIVLLLAISGVAAYVQVSDHAFFNGPVLAESDAYNASGHCPPYDAPVRGTIYDRNGVKLAWSVPDSNHRCGYRRMYADPTLSPLIGYFSYKYGTAGIESTYNDQLSGAQSGVTIQQVTNHLLHEPQYGQDIYLTIDERLQKYVNQVYNASAIHGNVCQAYNSDPNGSVTIENPNNGEILAMVSHPYFDANHIDDAGYFAQLQSDPNKPLLNHATQGLYDPGSTFKTMTLGAAINEGSVTLDTTFTKDDATHFVANGEHIDWVDYLNGEWQNAQFPLTVRDSFAYSDNTVFARLATQVGSDKWLSYARGFGLTTPGNGVTKDLGFDAPYFQSQTYNAVTNGGPTDFGPNLLAESGFGQGQLLVTPLTMLTVASTVAANGYLYTPHIGLKTVPHGVDAGSVLPTASSVYNQVLRPETASAVRQAMWAVAQYGTGSAGLASHNGYHIYDSPAHMGGKTGTAQTDQANPETWWIGIAPDDAAGAGSGPAKYAVTVMKEHSGEGACQVYVANDSVLYAMQNNIGY